MSFKKSTLKILQVSEISPGIVKAWIIFDAVLEAININIKRKIYINTYKSDLPDNFKPVKMILPRNKPVLNLYEIDIDEKEFIEKFNNFNDYIIDPSIEGVYETKVNMTFRAIADFGSQMRYVGNRKVTFVNQTFQYEDFESKPITNHEGNNYITEYDFAKYYFYHSNLAGRHFVALMLFPHKKMYIYLITQFTNNKKMEIPNLKTIVMQSIRSEAEHVPIPAEVLEFDFEVQSFVEQDIKIAIKNVNKIIFDLKTNNVPSILILQSSYKTSRLVSLGFNMLSEYPTMEIPFNSDDNTFPALDWMKFAAKKLAYRYIELNNILEYRLQMSKYCNIPLCNMESDASVFCSDVIFSRLLKQSKQVLWYSLGFPDLGGGSDNHDFLGEVEYEFPKISNAGMYLGYSVEIDLGLFCVNSILESEHIKDLSGNYDIDFVDPKNKKNESVIEYHLERDEFVLGSNAFFVMKKMVEKWLNDVKNYENYCSDMLLVHFYRWIASSNSKFFDPVIHRMINKLMQKYFSVLVRKVKDFGFNIIYADYKKIFIFNNKSDFNDFHSSVDYLFRAIKKIQIFNHITLTVNTFWKIILFKDYYNYAGIQEVEGDSNKVISKWTLAEFLPKILERDFISLISDYIFKLFRFYYEKNYEMVTNLYNLYCGKDMSLSDGKAFIEKPESYKEFKQFLIKDYISNKVFNMIPNIIKKREDRYEDEEYEAYQEEPEIEGQVFTRKDFMEEDEDEADFQNENMHIRKRKIDMTGLWEFPVKLGSYQNATNLPLEYVKYISEVLSLDEDVAHNSFVVKKSALKIIKIEEFSDESIFKDPCRTFILHDVICQLCSNYKDLDFCRDKTLLEGQWACDLCNAPLDKGLIEYLIIEKVKKLIDYYFNQDLYCKKCKLQKNELINVKCDCAGEYAKTFEDNIFKNSINIKSMHDYIDNLIHIAGYYSFEILKGMLNQFKNY